MKFTVDVKKRVTFDIKWLCIEAAVRYDEEDMPNDFPGRKGDMWCVRVDVDTGQIWHKSTETWPAGMQPKRLCMKVCDCGNYELRDVNDEVVARRENDYVPYDVGIGGGDYIEMEIGADGVIKDYRFWDIEAFTEDNEGECFRMS